MSISQSAWRRSLLAALVAGCASAPTVAKAAGNHHSMPLGGRTALMGGTGIALGADGAAPFMNPANIARIRDHRIAFSARFFRLSEHRYRGWYQLGESDDPGFAELRLPDVNATRHEFHSLPDSTCYFFSATEAARGEERKGRQKVALCAARIEDSDLGLSAVTYSESSGGRRVHQMQYFAAEWYRASIGPAWASYLTPNLSLGAALFVTRTKHLASLVVSTVTEELGSGQGTASSYEALSSAYSWDLVPSLGLTYHFSPTLVGGLSLRLPGPHLLGGFSGGFMASFAESTGARRQWLAEGDFKAKPPVMLGLGVGAEWRRVRLELDLFYTLGQSDYMHAEVRRTELLFDAGQLNGSVSQPAEMRESTSSVLNAGLGAEVFIARRLSMLGGLQTDVNALADLESGTDETRIARTRVNYYRAGLGLSSYTDLGDLVLGLRFDYGRGQAAGVNAFTSPPRRAVAEYREYAAMLVLAGSISWGSVKAAADHIGEVVEGDAAAPASAPLRPTAPPKARPN